jgi:hypothetical protein
MAVNSVVDRRRFDADTDPVSDSTSRFKDDPDPDPDPTTSYTHVENHNFLSFIHGNPVYTIFTFLVSHQHHRCLNFQ